MNFELKDCNVCGEPLSEHRNGLACCWFCEAAPEIRHIGNEHVKKQVCEIACTTFGCFAHQRVAILNSRGHTYEWAEQKCRERWNTRAETAAERELAECRVALVRLSSYLAQGGMSCEDHEITGDKFYKRIKGGIDDIAKDTEALYETAATRADKAEARVQELEAALVSLYDMASEHFHCCYGSPEDEPSCPPSLQEARRLIEANAEGGQ